MKTNGECLCGAVEVEVDLSNPEMAACHCSMCRNWSGTRVLEMYEMYKP